MTVRFVQDPEAVLDYTVDWSEWLVPDDFLVSVAFIAGAGLNVLSANVSDSVRTGRANSCGTVWLSGGVVGQTYNSICHITTDSGRQDERTFLIVIKQK